MQNSGAASTPCPQRAGLNSVPRRAALFCLNMERFCRDELKTDFSGQSVVVSYSGGADSKALLFALCRLSARLRITVHAAILDHGFREEAAAETADAHDVCDRLGVALHTEKRNVAAWAQKKGIGLEEAGRLARQKFLETVRAATGSQWIAVGHQLNDLAEDSIMRMIRGAGWPALAGMAGVVRQTRTIRPLLLVPRAAIELFLTDIGEPWHVDRMNADEAFLRNRVRSRLLPLFVEENPSFLDSVAERWRMAREDEAFFTANLAAIPATTRHGGVFLPRAVLMELSGALRLRKYIEVLASLGRGQALAVHVRALDAAWRRNEGGKRVQFPGGKSALVREGGIVFLGPE